MNFYNIVLSPLEEKHILDSKVGELIVDLKYGHFTINANGVYKSKTKELESLVDSLMILKENLLKRYKRLVDLIDYLVKFKKHCNDEIKKLLDEKDKLRENLEKTEQKINNKIKEFSSFYSCYRDFLYNDLKELMIPIKENLKKLLQIKSCIDECKFLLNDWNTQKAFNEANILLIQ